MMARTVVAALTMLLLVTGQAWAAAQTSLQEVEREVMCTTCGVPLQVAESPAADAQRRQIRRLVDAGLTKRQVEDRLVAIYGPQVLAMPRDDAGLSLTAYVLPALLVLLAAGMVAGAARTWRRRTPRDETSSPSAAETHISAEAEARVDADLAEYER